MGTLFAVREQSTQITPTTSAPVGENWPLNHELLTSERLRGCWNYMSFPQEAGFNNIIQTECQHNILPFSFKCNLLRQGKRNTEQGRTTDQSGEMKVIWFVWHLLWERNAQGCLYFNFHLSIWGHHLFFLFSKSIFPETVPAVCLDYRMVDTSFLTNMSVGRERIWGQGTTMLYRLKGPYPEICLGPLRW